MRAAGRVNAWTWRRSRGVVVSERASWRPASAAASAACHTCKKHELLHFPFKSSQVLYLNCRRTHCAPNGSSSTHNAKFVCDTHRKLDKLGDFLLLERANDEESLQTLAQILAQGATTLAKAYGDSHGGFAQQAGCTSVWGRRRSLCGTHEPQSACRCRARLRSFRRGAGGHARTHPRAATACR